MCVCGGVYFLGLEAWDIKKGQGRRSDLEEVVEKIKAKRPWNEIAEQHSATYVRNHKGMKALAETLTVSLRTNSWDKPGKYKWIWGPTGIGKTEEVFKTYGADRIYVKDNSKWFDGFDTTRHTVVLLDDFRKSKDGISYDDLLRIAQPYDYRVQTKGGYVSLGMQDIIVTSNLDPVTMFAGDHDMTPLLRRFHVINRIKKEVSDSPPACIDLTIED